MFLWKTSTYKQGHSLIHGYHFSSKLENTTTRHLNVEALKAVSTRTMDPSIEASYLKNISIGFVNAN